MIKAILGALESNKYVTLTFSINGGQVQIVASARSDKGVNTPPVNLLTSEDDFDNVLVKVLENLWIKGRKTGKDRESARSQDCEVGKDCESARVQECEAGKDCESARVQDCEVAEPEKREPEQKTETDEEDEWED